MFKARFWKNFDWILLGVTGLLVTIGLVVIYATTFKEAGQVAPADVRNQIVYALLGLVALLFVAHIDYRAWRKLTTWMYFASIMLLVIVRIAGRTVLGGQRWISLGFFQLQPSELTKLSDALGARRCPRSSRARVLRMVRRPPFLPQNPEAV